MSGSYQGVVQAQRRTWNRAEYAQKAQEKEAKEKNKQRPDHTREKKDLEERDHDLGASFKEAVGKRQLQGANSGFYCEICDCLMKDSAAFTDHCNGKKHQAMKGMLNVPKKATLNDVQKRIRENELKKKEEQIDYETKLRRQREENEKEDQLLKEVRKEAKRRKKEEQLEEENSRKELWDEEDLNAAGDMGLPFSFGGSKKHT